MTSPTSTYRLQINADFTLHDAADVCGYLADLGVGAVYLSPLLTATQSSDHGYDAVDPTAIDPTRGGEEGWQRFVTAARAAGLQIVLDIVPNHLGVADAAQNPSWWSTLRLGPDSPYASWYDIEWTNLPIRLPVLGSADDLDSLTLSDDRSELRYWDHRFPVAPGTADDGADARTVHDRQHYRLIDWRLGDSELTYRRFFAVTTLAGVRVEDRAVFDATHARIRAMVEAGEVDGLRVDHPDGLVDPRGYFTWLRALAGERWLLGEKILEHGERLPDWPIEGTTGYDAMTEVNQVFVDPAAERAMTDLYVRLTGDERTCERHIVEGKTMIVNAQFAAERNRMARLVPDLPADDVTAALAAVAVQVPVYRSYVPDGVEVLDEALVAARGADPGLASTLDALSARLHDANDELAQRFQQLSGAVMAKGVEDTAYYRYARFIAFNEVGGNPGRFGITVDDFHADLAHRRRSLPESMTALSTHDTKRGEDVRARLAVLAEIPQQWADFATAFVEKSPAPDRAFSYFLAQTLAGTGRIDSERLHDYAEKAMREAAVGTTWTDPDDAFENRVHAAVDAAFDDPALSRAWDELDAAITAPGWSNALGAKLVQLLMPGVPDVYQGTELWDDSLVDPDNRRPVNYEARQLLLSSAPSTVNDSGAAKLHVVATALRLRRDRKLTTYRPVAADGAAAGHVLAFDRGGVVAVATLRPVGLAAAGGWGDTTLQLDGRWRDELTGAEHAGPIGLDELLGTFPVALLTRAE